MAYDEALASHVRGLLGPQEGVTERAMFGGLAFLVDGRMAVAVSSRGVLMVRADDEGAGRLLARPDVTQTRMGERAVRGWVDLDTTSMTDADLADAVIQAAAYARTLPAR